MVKMSISTMEASGLLTPCYNIKVHLILVLSNTALYSCSASKFTFGAFTMALSLLAKDEFAMYDHYVPIYTSI